MANERAYLQCAVCGGTFFLVKWQTIYNVNGRSALDRELLADWFQSHLTICVAESEDEGLAGVIDGEFNATGLERVIHVVSESDLPKERG